MGWYRGPGVVGMRGMVSKEIGGVVDVDEVENWKRGGCGREGFRR